MSETVLVLGATSAIAQAYAAALAGAGATFVLVGRNGERLSSHCRRSQGARRVRRLSPVISDLADMSSCERRFLDFCARLGMPDQVLHRLRHSRRPACGGGGCRSHAARSSTSISRAPRSGCRWRRSISPAIEPALDHRHRLGCRRSRAALELRLRRRQGGLDRFAEGLAHRLHGTGLHVLTVKPGFVDTPMTAHLDKGGPLWAKPDRVAADIEQAVRRGRPSSIRPGSGGRS